MTELEQLTIADAGLTIDNRLTWHQQQAMWREASFRRIGRDVGYGYRNCDCCGTTDMGPLDNEPFTCDGCDERHENHCDPAKTQHCFTGHCDGSGCSYPGECEGAPAPSTKSATKEDQA